MSDFVDPYFDDSIGTLRNLLGAKSSEELRKLEPQVVFANELELELDLRITPPSQDRILSATNSFCSPDVWIHIIQKKYFSPETSNFV